MKKLQSWFKNISSKMSQVKMSSLLDKEGFYIVLFLCLCVVVTTAVWAVRNYNAGLLNRQGDDMVEYNKEDLFDNNNLFSWDFEDDTEPMTDNEDNKDKETPKDNKGSQGNNTNQDNQNNQGSQGGQNDEGSVPTSTKPTAMATPVFSNKISLDFGEFKEIAGFKQDHLGVDIEAQAGEAVRAALKGKVLKVYYLEDNDNPYDGYGNIVVLGHDNGLVTVYGNLHEIISVVEGEAVDAGQVIASVGQSSWLKSGSAPHLHFRVMKDNKEQDPKLYLTNLK